jgi:hypothetical protein
MSKPYLPHRLTLRRRCVLCAQEYKRLRSLKLSRWQAADMASFYTVFPLRTVLSFIAGILVASLFLGMTKAHGAELKLFQVEHKGMTKTYRVPSCVKARDAIVKQRTRGALGIKFFCDGRRI